ncbi:uncharacterized protein LOC131430902 [Malaya genurostris]|uniref:uncharacterized protein LOC131430902 n=1 Tax=Malaya genurostris TaxID=325434 RepID=UPI0026F39D8B|nr:uncharacterized protein LOC131430902 [Malaya genurostris]
MLLSSKQSALFILLTVCSLGTASLPTNEYAVSFPEWFSFHRQTKVDIHILEPIGLQIWSKYRPQCSNFGVELLINPTDSEIGYRLSKNVSVPQDGKFFIEDNNAAVKLGDTIKYRTVKTEDGEDEWSHWKTVLVDKSLFVQKGQHCSNHCRHNEDNGKVLFLKEYIEKILANCELHWMSEKLFFPLTQAHTLVSDPERFIKTRLYSIDLLRPMIDHVKNVYVAQDGVGFGMHSIIEKLKVLELGRNELGLVDYDDYIIEPGPSLPAIRNRMFEVSTRVFLTIDIGKTKVPITAEAVV